MGLRLSVILASCLLFSGCFLTTGKDKQPQTKSPTVGGVVLLRDVRGVEDTSYVYAEFAHVTERETGYRSLLAGVPRAQRDGTECKIYNVSSGTGFRSEDERFGRDIFPAASRIGVGKLWYGPAANQQFLIEVPSEENIYLQYVSEIDSELKQIRAEGSAKAAGFSAAFSVPTELEEITFNAESAGESIIIKKEEDLKIGWRAPHLVNEDSIMGFFLRSTDAVGTRELRCLKYEKDFHADGAAKAWRIRAEFLAQMPSDTDAELTVLRGHLVQLRSGSGDLIIDVEATRNWELKASLERDDE